MAAYDLKPEDPAVRAKCEACVNALQESITNGESGDPLSHYLVAAGLRRLDHLGAAVAYWQRAEERMRTTKTPLDDETSKWRDEVRASITHLLDDQGRLKARDPVSKGDPGWQRNVDLLVDYGTALQELGRLNEAIEAYDELLAIAPDSYVVSLARGNAYLRRAGTTTQSLTFRERLRLPIQLNKSLMPCMRVPRPTSSMRRWDRPLQIWSKRVRYSPS